MEIFSKNRWLLLIGFVLSSSLVLFGLSTFVCSKDFFFRWMLKLCNNGWLSAKLL